MRKSSVGGPNSQEVLKHNSDSEQEDINLVQHEKEGEETKKLNTLFREGPHHNMEQRSQSTKCTNSSRKHSFSSARCN
ncbi:hypothetical protein GWI33_020743 [Rhynchophorus ferrugineus]|uniref:Uncharacterized protein n=1 Tax=Rhynchophorus ferrugineus TaxID=354439 RepID=A0A834HPS6_RHYFE|nr:hypothetical protein GWI33_020743 [Rhynchophorus ferrugineus]